MSLAASDIQLIIFHNRIGRSRLGARCSGRVVGVRSKQLNCETRRILPTPQLSYAESFYSLHSVQHSDNYSGAYGLYRRNYWDHSRR